MNRRFKYAFQSRRLKIRFAENAQKGKVIAMDKNQELEDSVQESDGNDKLIQDILNARNSVHSAKKEQLNKNADETEEPAKVTSEPAKEPEEPKRTNSKKKKKKKRSYKKFYVGLILAVVIVIISAVAAMYIIDIGKEVFGINKPDTALEIVIPSGASTEEIADILVENGLIREPLVFRLVSRIKKADALYIEGTHTLKPSMTYETMIAELQKETPRETVDVTFPEGYTMIQSAQALEEAGVCSAKDFIYTFNNTKFGFNFENEVVNNSLKFYKMEGYLFPDTYTFYKDSDPEIVAKKIYTNFDAKIDPGIRGRMKEIGLSLEDTIILASIVQGEAPVSYEMKNVASVFFNRLDNKDTYPLLQSDVTTKYVNQVIKPNIELANDAMYVAYDTYQGPGLPPGAVCNPGMDAIEAVLYPNDTDYYYFCSNLKTLEFFYAKTLSVHENNLVKAGLK